MIIDKAESLKGTLTVPGDKSISHRAVMLGSLSEGDTYIRGFLKSADCLATIDCFRRMGIDIEENEDRLIIHGKGLHGLRAPKEPLNAMNSGTTTRILSGILAGQDFPVTIIGDESLSRRPMKRIIDPLSRMGCRITSVNGNNCLPLTIHGGSLAGIRYESPVASAQVKSCVAMAALYADSPVTITEPYLSRNHTELMLRGFGGDVTSFTDPETGRPACTVMPGPRLTGQSVTVPGDISSAAYFIAAALLVPNSEVTLKNVGINPTRDGILRVARAMGGSVEVTNLRSEGGEPTADLIIRSSALHGTTIGGALIPTLIDELPVITVMAACAEGTTVIRDAGELRVKESDRLSLIAANLRAMGVALTETEDGIIMEGKPLKMAPLRGVSVDPKKDHRMAMAFAVAGLVAEGPTEILDAGCVDISYPNFFEDLASLGA
ncbi:MAG: 3-phosphoshikimate 1-carboxyvinyltransferase [Lachnospiraceae bacterium]|nr:3-phosphoshikimate 1-carboxyvinyltransferase [Lachnospiraceae bacterium]